MTHRTLDELTAGLGHIAAAPPEHGRLEMIVRRPAIGERENLERGELDLIEGLVGDTWSRRPSSRTPDGTPHPDMQLNIMAARVIALIAGGRERWPLAGDQLFVDLDLSAANLPPGSRLTIGGAVLEITPPPHLGCGKFIERFGVDAMKFVNSPTGRALNLRGVNARVVRAGTIAVGDAVRRMPPGA